jgi:hypothetical protein
MLLAGLVFPAAAGTSVYRCVAADGKVSYSDQTCGGGSQTLGSSGNPAATVSVVHTVVPNSSSNSDPLQYRQELRADADQARLQALEQRECEEADKTDASAASTSSADSTTAAGLPCRHRVRRRPPAPALIQARERRQQHEASK